MKFTKKHLFFAVGALLVLGLMSAKYISLGEKIKGDLGWEFTPYEFGAKHLKYSEGYSEKSYADGPGYKTVGWGSCTSSGNDIPDQIDMKDAHDLLNKEFENIVNSMKPKLASLPINEQYAYYLTAYRCGYPTVLASDAVKFALAGDSDKAFEELSNFKCKSLWDKNRQIVLAHMAYQPFMDAHFSIYDMDKKSPTYGEKVVNTSLKMEMDKYDESLKKLYTKYNFKFK